MMKKLAVAVFALSLTALGCGSDDGGGKTDAAPKLDGPPGAEVQIQPDVPVTGPEAGPEVKRDVTTPLDQTVDKVTPIDVPADKAPIDVPAVDVPAIDGPAPVLDGSTLDTQAGETAKPAIDGGVDGGSVG